MDILSVGELNKLINTTFEEKLDSNFSVTGEISNFKLSNSHAYFTLKDENASINSIIWKYTFKKLTYTNGDKVICNGKLNFYTKTGNSNIIINTIEKAGIGDLHKQYIENKAYFENLKYFDKKKPMPNIIINIGIVTSSEGAALQDFLFLMNKNNYVANIKIKNSIVQGPNCPKSIVSGIELLDKLNLDVIILMRGGGSFEDLIGFSNPYVIEAIHNAKTFTISAIGHEIDYMLSDYVADLRAPTPSIAAEMIMKHNIKNHIQLEHDNQIIKINNSIRKYTDCLKIPNLPMNEMISISDIDGNIINYNNITDYKKMKLIFPEGDIVIEICQLKKL